jgi:triacylglycerol esterase/lipase EstA (alpha/beta hydrolase family)
MKPVLISLLLTVTLASVHARGPTKSSLRVVAKTGTRVGTSTITTIRSGVSINDYGTVAFAGLTADGRSTVFGATPDGLTKDLRPGNTLVSGYGVQINRNNDVAFLVGPGISGSDYCIPNSDPTDPGRQCLESVSASTTAYSILSVNALAPGSPRIVAYSVLFNSFDPSLAHTANGPFASLGPAFSFNSAGQAAFLTDTSLNRQLIDYHLGTTYDTGPWHLFPNDGPLDPTAYPLIADNGTIVLKTSPGADKPLFVLDSPLLHPTVLASTDQGFDWIGAYPGITRKGDKIAFVANPNAAHGTLSPGEGLFLSTIANGVWASQRVLGTNVAGSNVFSNFHKFYRTSVAELATLPNTVKICFGAASNTGRVGLYAVTFDYRQNAVVALETLMEAGRDVAGLGTPSSFDLFDSVNDQGEVVFWVRTASGDAVVEAAPQIEAIDPLPELLDEKGIISDVRKLGLATNLVEGLAADGVTRVVLRVEVPSDGDVTFDLHDENGNTFGTGSLSDVASTTQTAGSSQLITHSARMPDGRFMAFAVLQSPRDFVRPLENDEPKIFRGLQIVAKFAPQEHLNSLLARRQLRLHRPPVALLHGIWGSANSTWRWFNSKWSLFDDPRFSIYLHDYSASSPFGLDTNVGQAKAAVDATVRNARADQRIAVVQCDVIAHSMGGLLARLYVAAGNPDSRPDGIRYLDIKNYEQGDIHKLITVDTPHVGSELCDLLISPSGIQRPGAILAWALGCVTCGSIEDMRTFSNPINNLPGARVPAHAISGVGGQKIVNSLKEALKLLKAKKVPTSDSPEPSGDLRPFLVNPNLVSAFLAVIDIAQILTFGSDPNNPGEPNPHDLTISRWRQEGGLQADHVSRFDADILALDLGIHFSIPGEPRVGKRVMELLNAPVTVVQFETNGFPSNSALRQSTGNGVQRQGMQRIRSRELADIFVHGLKVQSIIPGTNVEAGTTVQVSVSGADGFQPTKVLVIGSFGADSVEGPPFSLAIDVPAYFLGPLSFKCFGVDANGVFGDGPQLTLQVFTSATLTNLSIAQNVLYLFDYAPSNRIEVSGTFSDGVLRELPVGDLLFTSTDPTVASVSEGGIIEARNVGQTTVIARRGELSAFIRVEVRGTTFGNAIAPPTERLAIVPIGTNVFQALAINNLGQVLVTLRDRDVTPALWQNGVITPLDGPPGRVATVLTDSGIVGGNLGNRGGAVVWFSPSNFVRLNYTNGPPPPRWGGAFFLGLFDSEAGVSGAVRVPGDVGDLGDVGAAYLFRFNGMDVGVPVNPTGVPAGYAPGAISRANRNGIMAGRLNIFDQGGITGSRPIRIEATDQVTLLEGYDGTYGDVEAIDNAGDIVGYLPGGFATLWRGTNVTYLWKGDGADATAINNRQHVAIYRSGGGQPGGAAIWADGQIVRLQQLFAGTEWKDFGAIAGLNDNGWAICNASRGNGEEPALIKLGPVVDQQPMAGTKAAGQSFSLSATPLTIGSATFQWRKDGTNLANGPTLSGVSTTNLVITAVAVSDAGKYDLVVTDAYGTVTSSNALLTVPSQNCLPAPDGLIAQWTGDDTGQEILNRFHAVVNNVQYQEGRVNSAFSFNGSDSFISTDLDLQPNGMPTSTWETWVFPARVSNGPVQMIMGAGEGTAFESIGIDSGKFTIYTGPAPDSFWPVTDASTNTWQHIAVIFYSNRVEFYKNAQRFETHYFPLRPPVLTRASLLTIGNVRGRSAFFQGLIDEVSIYNRALSQAEIQAIYDVGAAGKCRPAATPTFAAQPASQTTYAGFDVTFEGEAQGTAPLSYQWYLSGTNPVTGATSPVLPFLNTQPLDGGIYTLVVRNAYGTTSSSAATLTVRPACEGEWKKYLSLSDAAISAMAFDATHGVTVALNTRGETRTWDGTNWRLADTSARPPQKPGPRDGTRMAYDSGRGVTVLFGGSSLGDTWEWDGSSWTLQASSGPPPRGEHAMAYDPVRGVTVMFGGYKGPGQSYGDTWQWDGVAWCQVAGPGATCATTCTNSPPPRRTHQMVFDQKTGKILLFGGVALDQSGNEFVANDTWEWDGACWQSVPMLRAPALRGFAMVYDPVRQTEILFGGSHADGQCSNQLWARVDNSWIPVPSAGPGQSCVGVGAYDTARNTLVFQAAGSELWEWATPKLPVFQIQPASVTNFVGENVQMTACAVGQASLAYQWFFNGSNALSAATSSALSLETIQASQAGMYSVVVSNTFGAITSIVATVVLIPCQAVPPGMVSWWRGESTGLDSWSTNHATINNNLEFSRGKVSQAFNFGIDGYLKINASSNLNLRAAQGITVEAWIEPSDLIARPILEWGRDDGATGVGFWTGTPDRTGVPGEIYVNVRDTSHGDHILASNAGTLSAGLFQHLAFTYNRPAGLLTLYRNGLQVAQKSVGTFANDTAGDIYLGHRPRATNQFAGSLDEVSLYNRALTPEEIAAIYASGSAGKCVPAPPTPLQFISVTTAPSTIRLLLQGSAGTLARIQRSTDLKTWLNLTNAILSTSALEFIDSRDEASRHRFYRAVVP